MSIKRAVCVAAPLLLVVLTAIAGYAYSQIQALSLPIPQALAIFTVFLPLLTGLSTIIIHHVLSRHSRDTAKPRPNLSTIATFALQIICETVIGTLSLTYMMPASSLECGLSEQWSQLFRSKNEGAIRRIQDAFDCCGFRTIQDQAWPFPTKKIGSGYCATRYQRNRACEEPWRQAEQINAGLLLLVVAIVFATKIVFIVIYFSRVSQPGMTSWFQNFEQITTGTDETPQEEDGANTRLLIDEGEAPEPCFELEIDDEEAPEPYRDDVDIRLQIDEAFATVNGTGDSRRVEPSGLFDAVEQWREDVEAGRMYYENSFVHTCAGWRTVESAETFSGL